MKPSSSPDVTAGPETPNGGSVQPVVGRRKKRVVFQFDERSLESRDYFEAVARAECWKLIEVQTTNGTVLIPDLR